jgi:hypothetical protein
MVSRSVLAALPRNPVSRRHTPRPSFEQLAMVDHLPALVRATKPIEYLDIETREEVFEDKLPFPAATELRRNFTDVSCGYRFPSLCASYF